MKYFNEIYNDVNAKRRERFQSDIPMWLYTFIYIFVYICTLPIVVVSYPVFWVYHKMKGV